MIKSIIGWVGGKAQLMWLINHLSPSYYDRFIDVFGGSGTVTLNIDCIQSTLRIYNDRNTNLTNLMGCACEHPMSLIREVGFLTLNARSDFEMCKKFLAQEEFTERDLSEELELTEIMFQPPQAQELQELMKQRHGSLNVKRAAMYYKLLRYSFNANGETFGGKRCDVRRFFADIWRFNRAFSGVVVECKDFESLIDQYARETAFIYCDPPYYNAEKLYEVEFTKDDHVRLHDVLVGTNSYIMVSYNNVPEIIELYQDFYIHLTTRPNSMSHKEGDLYEELVMTNYNPENNFRVRGQQMNLLDGVFPSVQDQNYTLIHAPEKPLKQ